MSKIHFSTPGCYRIEVEGMLPESWFGRLGDMQVFKINQETTSEVNNKITIMQGKVSDQADLSGILNSLYELHLSLLSVQFIDEEKGKLNE